MSRLNWLSTVALLPLFLFALTSCEFRPDDIPEAKISKPDSIGPPISFNLNDSFDTIRVG